MGVRSSQPRSPNLNKTDGHLLEYYRNTFVAGGGANAGPTIADAGMTASGGNITEYTDSGTVYRAHVFLTTDTFQVTELATDSNLGNTVDILLIGGGGGGGGGNGDYGSGGGGAGGFVEVTSYTVAEATYPITVGGGGSGGMGGYPQNYSRRGINGGDTIFTNPSPETITAKGGIVGFATSLYDSGGTWSANFGNSCVVVFFGLLVSTRSSRLLPRVGCRTVSTNEKSWQYWCNSSPSLVLHGKCLNHFWCHTLRSPSK